MKKKIYFLMLLFVFLSFLLLHKKTVLGASTANSSPLETYGFRVTILSYTGEGKPEQLGKPILVYQPGLLDDWQEKVSGSYPKGEDAYSQLMTQKWGLTQIMPVLPSDQMVDASVKEIRSDENVEWGRGKEDDLESSNPNNTTDAASLHSEEEWGKAYFGENTIGDILYGISENNKAIDLEKAVTVLADCLAKTLSSDNNTSLDSDLMQYIGMYNDPTGSNDDKIDAMENMVNYLKDNYNKEIQMTYELAEAIEGEDGKSYNQYLFEYGGSCGYEDIAFTAEYIKSLPYEEAPTDRIIRDYLSNERTISFPFSAIDLSEYYKRYEDIGTAYEIAKKYGSNPTKIKTYFGITVDPMDMKNIYVQVEVVQRMFDYLDEHQTVIARTQVGQITHTQKKPGSWGAGKLGSYWYLDSVKCPSGYQGTSEKKYGVDADGDEIKGPSSCQKWKKVVRKIPIGESCDKSNNETDEGVPKGEPVRVCSHYEVADSVDPEMYYYLKCSGSKTGAHGIERVYNIYGLVTMAPSYIVASREYGDQLKFNFSDKAKNSCTNEETTHYVEDKYGNYVKDEKTGEYIPLYYVGPNLEKALVGPASVDPSKNNIKNRNYLHTLNDAKWDNGNYSCNSDNGSPELGISYYYFLQHYECQLECERVTKDNSSDAYLMCAEQYAENYVDLDLKGENTRAKKWDMIINGCGYTYGVSPTSGNKTDSDRESVDSCNNSSSVHTKGIAYNYIIQQKIADLESSCNIIDGKYAPNSLGINVPSCTGDYVTDFDGSDAGDTWFDARTYINKICKDTTSFGFKDTRSENLVKGGGFSYPVIQEGERECTYFFNKEQWKVDYASAPERDPDARKRLQYILDKFNAIGNNSSVASITLTDNGDINMYGNTYFENETFKYNETSVNTSTEEYVTTKNNPDKNNLGMEITKVNQSNPNLVVSGNEKVYKIEDGKKTELDVNRYVSKDEVNVTYEPKKVCLSTDGLSKITDSPSNGVCYKQTVNGKTSDVLAQRKYYTNYQIKPNNDNKVYTTVTVGNDGNNYYKDNEACTYKVTDSTPYSCILKVEGDPIKNGNGVYTANSLTVKLYYSISSSLVNSVSILDNNLEKTGDSVTISNTNSRTVQRHVLYGNILLNDGSKVSCSLPLELISEPTCNVGCSIEKVNETLYEIKSTGSASATHFYTYTSSHKSPTYTELISNNSNPYSFMTEVLSSVTDQGKKYVRLSEGLQDKEVLYGYVTTNDPSCNASCSYTNSVPPPEYDCYKLFKPANYTDIGPYCEAHHQDDVNGFSSEDDCFTKCTVHCPNNCDNEEVNKNFCSDAETYGYGGDDPVKTCMNQCNRCPGPDDYTFRTVNVYNPFPNSSVSVAPYEKGNRPIGKNWAHFEDYIIDDSNDSSTVTGDNANKKVEYVIDLTPSDIRAIRNNTKTSEINLSTNKRRVYTKLDRVTTNQKDVVEKYKSQFINQEYAGLFKTRHGDIPASFSPGN